MALIAEVAELLAARFKLRGLIHPKHEGDVAHAIRLAFDPDSRDRDADGKPAPTEPGFYWATNDGRRTIVKLEAEKGGLYAFECGRSYRFDLKAFTNYVRASEADANDGKAGA